MMLAVAMIAVVLFAGVVLVRQFVNGDLGDVDDYDAWGHRR